MNNNRFFQFIELKYNDLSNQVNTWLQSVYQKSSINFNSSSPYGQILNVLKELFQHVIIYIKNTIKILDINTTQNIKVAQQTARIAGYSVGRAISATGTLKFTLKQGVEVSKEIKDSIIIINNETIMTNKSNSLKYSTNFSTNEMIYPISQNSQFFVSVIQGVWETQNFTGDGTINQSYSVNIPNSKQVENFNYQIKYNGIVLSIKDHMYDMLNSEYSCIVKSGFNGGIDIYFGNTNFGFIPTVGSNIEVKYLLSDGADGEILNPKRNDFKFLTQIKDGQGNDVNIEDLFDIDIQNDINFASNGDTLDFIKSSLPHVSRNFVLGTPKQFIFHLKKLNMFSKVNAYNKLSDNNSSITEEVIEKQIKNITYNINNNKSKTEIINSLNKFNDLYDKHKTNLNDNEIYLYLIPDIKKYFNDDTNYFNIPFDAFYLDDDEKNKIITYLRQLGTLSNTIEINIVQPKISRYVMHVYIKKTQNGNEDNIRQEIIAKSSNYLLNNDRFDRLPKSDFIKMFKEINGVDSASVFFISKKNEDYHKSNKDKNNYNEDLLLGIDNLHGDIVIDNDEYAIIRGGWKNRNDIWYNEDLKDNSLNSINITFN